MSFITGIHHICIKCSTASEFSRVSHFYHEILSLPIARSWDGGVMFDTGAGLIEVFANAEDAPGQGVIRHFALATDDVDAVVERVTAAGYEVFMGPQDIAIPSTPVFPARIAFCYGPMGEEIEFFQERD